MNTKICKGPLHPEGVELPIEDFRICKHTRIVKSNCRRFGKQFIRGEITTYFLRYTYCKKCEAYRTCRYQENHIEQTIRISRKFQRSKKGQDLHNKARKKWRLKNKDRENHKNRERKKMQVRMLSYTYVKFLWKLRFKKRGEIAPPFTNDIWLAESIRIQTLRKNKQLKKES